MFAHDDSLSEVLEGTGSASALDADVFASLDVSGYSSASLQITGTWSGTITFQGSNNNVDWVSAVGTNAADLIHSQISTTTANGLYYIPLLFKYFRARMTAYTSGTAISTYAFDTITPNKIHSTELPPGASTSANQTNNLQTTQLVNSSGNAVAVKTLGSTPLAADYGLETNSLIYGLTTAGGGGYVPVKVNPSGTMETACNQSGTWNIVNVSGVVSLPTGASTEARQVTAQASLDLLDDVPSAMNAAFSKGNPVMGQLDDTGTTAATENNVAPIRITPQRAQHINLRNQAGTEMGTATNPLSVQVEIIYPQTAFAVRKNQVLAAGVSSLYTSTVAQNAALTQFTFGGTVSGSATLSRMVTATTELVPSGGFNSTGDVSTWTYAGTYSVAPAYSTAQFTEGTGSVLYQSANTGTALTATYSWGTVTPKDFSAWRYISAQFYNTLATGGSQSRTISIILTDVLGSTRTYSLVGTTVAAPFTTTGWILLTGEIEVPTSQVGTFDVYNVASIKLQLLDGGNKTGTFGWDAVKFTTAITPIEKIYVFGNQTYSITLSPVELLTIGDVVGLSVKNTSAGSGEFSVTAKGVLR